MKRSFINQVIAEAMDFFASKGFYLPPYANFTPEDWKKNASSADEIFDLALGWDVTSFGSGDFYNTGLLLFTTRNGKPGDNRYFKPYAEKIMMVRENQITPRHFHWNKYEDIINRGGGNLVIELFHADPSNNSLTGEDFDITVNGFRRRMSSGDKLILTPGDSVCLEHCHAHRFYGEAGKGSVMVGEVSMVNDDVNDNCFIDGTPRFDPIEEDVAPRFLLSGEYREKLGL